MLKVGSFLRNPFAFLFTRSSEEEVVSAYVLREHGHGRSLTEILTDPYVHNRLSPEKTRRMLDRPELIHALGEQNIAAARQMLSG